MSDKKDYIDRMKDEAEELKIRIGKAEARLEEEKDPVRRSFLDGQLRGMRTYAQFLDGRISYETAPERAKEGMRHFVGFMSCLWPEIGQKEKASEPPPCIHTRLPDGFYAYRGRVFYR